MKRARTRDAASRVVGLRVTRWLYSLAIHSPPAEISRANSYSENGRGARIRTLGPRFWSCQPGVAGVRQESLLNTSRPMTVASGRSSWLYTLLPARESTSVWLRTAWPMAFAVFRRVCSDSFEFQSPQTVLKTAGLSFATVHQRPPTSDRQPPESVIVRQCPQSSIGLAVNLAVTDPKELQQDC